MYHFLQYIHIIYTYILTNTSIVSTHRCWAVPGPQRHEAAGRPVGPGQNSGQSREGDLARGRFGSGTLW